MQRNHSKRKTVTLVSGMTIITINYNTLKSPLKKIMIKDFLIICFITITLVGCSSSKISLSRDNVEVKNRDIIAVDNPNSLMLNDEKGDGLAIINNVEFSEGTIELEIKGENKPQKSFVGLAFNVQNDSTYEAVYFRPFNFQSNEKIRREHSVQYIYKPEYEWRFLRENHTGQYEAEFPRRPSPDDWFSVQITINEENVLVYDKKTKTELLSVKRLSNQISDKIALWVGYNSKGEFMNLKIKKPKEKKQRIRFN